MKYILLILSFLMLSFADENRLSLEQSPYLQQHKNDPVYWQGNYEDALKKAKIEDKPLFISIGYSTCHWCHVMHKESFLDPVIAKQLNENFISLKIDKEQYPQLDQKFQNIYYKLKGMRGGWPLNLFMTPQGEVFYITNYIPKHSRNGTLGFMELLEYLSKVYKDKKLLRYQISALTANSNETIKTQQWDKKNIEAFILSQMDDFNGGFGDAPKFPHTAKLLLVFSLLSDAKKEELETFVLFTLHKMHHSGLFDQVDGGFFRYCIDANWEIPHFEKMLYTQALMVQLYASYYQHYPKQEYKTVIAQTVTFTMEHLMYNNLFFSAVDADSQEQEGGYYLFTQQQLPAGVQTVMLENDKYHITDTLTKKQWQQLHSVRLHKPYPFRDKKINTAWNAMMITALFQASHVNKKYLLQAKNSLKALRKLMFSHGQLYHQTLPFNKPTQKALLEDYAFFIEALLQGYTQTKDEEYLAFATYLMQYALYHFYQDGVWYLDETHEVKADLNDKYYPSALSIMVKNLVTMAPMVRNNYDYKIIAKQTMNILKTEHIFPEESPLYLKNIVDFKFE